MISIDFIFILLECVINIYVNILVESPVPVFVSDEGVKLKDYVLCFVFCKFGAALYLFFYMCLATITMLH